MKYDFETIVDRDPALRGTAKYRIMEDSGGNKPPEGTVPLSVADMEFRTAPCILEAIKAEADYGVLGYHDLTDSFREACRGWMRSRHDWEIEPDWIVPFEQVVPALYCAVWTFTEPGDGVLIQTPDYCHFTGAAVNTGRRVLENRLVADERGHYTIDWDDFRAKAREAKLFFLCSPQNPTGRVWTREELARMGDICNEYGVMVVADEIHHDLIQPGYKHIPYPSLGRAYADNCVVCTSLSKTFNLAGLCFASLIIPNGDVRGKFQKQMRLQAFMHVSRFGPVAHEAAYRHGAEWLDELLQVIKGNFDYCKEFFARNFPEVVVTDPEGTYLLWCDFRSFGMGDKELKAFLTDECMLYLGSGTDFGEAGSGYQRINMACPRQILVEALDRLLAAAEKRGLKK